MDGEASGALTIPLLAWLLLLGYSSRFTEQWHQRLHQHKSALGFLQQHGARASFYKVHYMLL